MKRTWTIIGVSDVPTSFKWYQSLFGQPETRPDHADFGQILDSDGTVLLCLHQWGAHEHPSLMSRDEATPGNGLLLFFRVDDFDMALKRARALVARLEEEPHANPNTRTQEFSLRDPDGYYVTISAFSSLELGGHEPPNKRMQPTHQPASVARIERSEIRGRLPECIIVPARADGPSVIRPTR
jgi:catechol 2,3-dioxygenase-like lactoylglutathione lyase family enzyme